LRIGFGYVVLLASLLCSCGKSEKPRIEPASMSAAMVVGLQRKAIEGDMDSIKKLISVSYCELHDKELWRKWTLWAALHGDPDAQCSLFSFLIEDETEYSLLRSRFWLQKAKDKCKSPLMDANLKVLAEKITASEIDARRLPKTFEGPTGLSNGFSAGRVLCLAEKKALDGDPNAALQCANYCFNKNDHSIGLYWLEIASENGSPKAKDSMLAIRKVID